MKPHEILGMVEEAAGTRMYETKRIAAIKTIEKKQTKLDELNSVLSEEITPTLERLRGEKQNYMQWSKNNADMERMERFVIAADFMTAQRALETNQEGFSEMEHQVETLLEDAAQGREEISAKEVEIKQLTAQLAGEFDQELKATKSKEEKYSKELVKVTSAWQNSQAEVQSAERDLEAAKNLVQETKDLLTNKQTEIAQETQRIGSEKQAAADAEAQHELLKTKYQNMSAGISSADDDAGTLPQQISKAHSDSKTAEAKAQQAKMKIQHISKSLQVRLCSA